jgi:peptide-methionine (R)-S-oxide reductase
MEGRRSGALTPLLTIGTIGFVGVALIAAFVLTSQAFPKQRPEPIPIQQAASEAPNPASDRKAEYKKRLTEMQYRVTQEGVTEPAFKGKYWNTKEEGLYKCVCCGTTLFDSSTKFDSGTGWPSFSEPIDETKVDTRVDGSLITQRMEVVCRNCKAHLGHLFTDGSTSMRYSINSAALDFQETAPASKK